jgi:serine/threonine protein kinase
MGRLREALAAYDYLIREHPENAVAKIGRAEVLRQTGRREEALAAYESVLREHPENVVAKIGRAETLREMGQTERSYASHYGANTEIDEQQEQKYQGEGPASISGGPTNTRDPFRIRGTILNKKYKLIDFAGSGGMGAVYRALSLVDGSTVAIKILQPHILARSPEYAELFEREAKNAQSLDHPHIVKVFDSGKDEDLSYMVMEWVEGHSIEDALTQGQLPLSRLTNIFGQICSAVGFAHERNIIHLDLKPGNILLLDRPESDDFVKVIDFGLSRVISKESGTTVTKFRGTHQFCAPEQFGGKVSHRSDIYSLGATLYYLLTGVIPFGTSYINAKIHPNL